MPALEDAVYLATTAHRGQTDAAGLPFITHPLRVMLSFYAPEDEDARMAAVLHDIVEDTPVTLQQLSVCGYPSRIVEAIEALTRLTDEPYDCYIGRVSRNQLACRVKVADLTDNLDTRRPSTAKLPQAQIARYQAARETLLAVLSRFSRLYAVNRR